jgi:Asp/Glu/hydantoin racemase
VEPLRALATEIIPGVQVINFVDDSILSLLARNGGNLAEVEDRLVHYARYAQESGGDIILEACSSVGEVVPVMQEAVAIPVVRIDAEMAKAAVRQGNRIGVAATLPTTLRPTTRLLMDAGAATGRPIEIEPLLIVGAYEKLIAGDRDGHDALLVEALARLAGEVDVVVLAQASMARVLDRLPEPQRDRFLSSPQLAMTKVKELLAQQ